MINNQRRIFIQDAASDLLKKCNVFEYPIKMKDIILNHFDNCILGCLPLQSDVDAVTEYDPVNKVYVITINRVRTSQSLIKRLNFTLAHELGHIVLEHYKYGVKWKSSDPKSIYLDEEADEFAGNFLMPEDEIYFMPRNIKFISSYFFVSEIAASKRLKMVLKRNVVI